MVEGAIKLSGASSYKAFIGSGVSFRVEKSTLLEYKGNRKNSLKSVYLDEVTEYLCKKFKCEVITGIEVDDACVIAAYKNPNRFILGEDKDYYGCPIKYFNINKSEDGVVDCNKFGHIYRNSKGDVKGEGRMFFYWQVAAQDDSDNYKAHCFSDVPWGEVRAYDWIVGCKTDKEALEKVARAYQHLYPESKTVIGWRGEEITLDWLYVLNENWHMARMLRNMKERENPIDIHPVLEKYKIE
ncbi:hypothetical protein D3C85_1246220 [compost metagenome]